jgi:hypothetical protein
VTQQAILPGMLPDLEFGDEFDFWATPRDAIEPIIPVLRDELAGTRGWHVIDPGCGTGAILDTVLSMEADLGVEFRHAHGIEIHAARAAEARERLGSRATIDNIDFTRWSRLPDEAESTPLLVVGNPPYSKAVEFVEHALKLAGAECSDGIVAMLLQLDFATGVERAVRIHDKHRSSLYPLRRRPKFGGPHASGERPFAWFVWNLDDPTSEWRVL